MKMGTNAQGPVAVSVGELLVDFISEGYVDSLEDAKTFTRLAGGSPANLAGNLARLGVPTALVASVGQDDMGEFLYNYVQDLGLQLDGLRRVPYPSTLILVTRSKAVSNFEAYRMADSEITYTQLSDVVAQSTVRLLHTTAFALSREPAQSAIMRTAREAHERGLQLSIDANYAAKIWPERTLAKDLLESYMGMGALVKMSEVDWERLYQHPLTDAAEAANYLLGLGAKMVCMTMGEQGSYVSNGAESHYLPVRPVAVKDTTGAGDAFWGGFLAAWLRGASPLECAMTGRNMAELKLAVLGSLPKEIDAEKVFSLLGTETKWM